jgi:hypothetical protein
MGQFRPIDDVGGMSALWVNFVALGAPSGCPFFLR